MALQGLLDSWPNDPLLREEVAVSVLNLAEITDHIGSSDDIIAAWDRATTTQPHVGINENRCRFFETC